MSESIDREQADEATGVDPAGDAAAGPVSSGAATDGKRSAVERIKSESRYLRGAIARELTDANAFVSKESLQLLKFHGTYQQDHRDLRGAPGPGGKSSRQYMFMVRTRVPGGKLTSEQLLAELDLCDEIGNATLRITTRQGLQLHGVLKRNLKRAIRRINEVQISTLAACGDVERNIMCCPAPHRFDPIRDQLQALTDRLVAHLAPRTRAYHEIWLTDTDMSRAQRVDGLPGEPADEQVEPLYGRYYLPRKFKTAVGLPDDNCVDMYANDLALMAVCEEQRIIGFNVLVGGSFGVVPSAKKTFPALARRMAFIEPDQALAVAEAIIKVQRDFGNREDRKLARMKYLIARWGLERFKAKVEEYLGASLPDPHPRDVTGVDDHLGWHPQGDGRWYYGINVENGRILDTEEVRYKSALREICRTFRPGIRLTSNQSLLLCDIHEEQRLGVEEILCQAGVKGLAGITPARRWSLACPALPTCGLAVAESERVLPGIVDHLDKELAGLGLSSETFSVRMTGCPNGCARPYNADIGLVGKTTDKYTIYLGGRILGDRLNFIYRDLVPTGEIVAALMPVFARFRAERLEGEGFGDFCHRLGPQRLAALAEQTVRATG